MLESLPGVGSVTPGGGAMVAVFAMLPVVAVTSAFSVKVRLPPAGKVGITMPAPSRSATVLEAGQTAPPVALPQVIAVFESPATAGSVITALSAGLGPALVTVRV